MTDQMAKATLMYASQDETSIAEALLSKVPHVTIAFWIIKILATTVGETGGDALSMQLHLGYRDSSLIFLGFFAITLTAQVISRRFHPAIYWAVVVATTTVGTTTSDYLDRTLGLGYPMASAVLLAGVIATIVIWRLVMGRIKFEQITLRKDEIFYWVTILITNTLGTALGDYAADDLQLGFQRGALAFTSLLAVVVGLYFFTRVPRSILFWAAYILTRPLGATLGDTLTKPRDAGGLDLGRIESSLVILLAMIVAIVAVSLFRRDRSSLAEPANGQPA